MLFNCCVYATSVAASVKYFMQRYRFDPHSFPETYRSLAQTSIRADFPSGNVPTTLVLRRISRFIRSITLFVRIFNQCCDGKSMYVKVSSIPSSTFLAASFSRMERNFSATSRAFFRAASFSGEILALEMRDNMKKELGIDTVRQLQAQYGKLLQGVTLHSDRVSQYTSEAFQEELRTLGIIQSLSGTGHCFDNARMESFFATLKKEKIYQIAAYKLTRAQVKTIVFRYVFTYYNRIRVCSVNPGGLPPVKYREWVAAHAA